MKKIVVTKNMSFYPDQLERLKGLWEVKFYKDEASSEQEWLERCLWADIICSWGFGSKSEKVYELEDTFISLPFVGVEFFDIEKLKSKNITISNSPWCNKEAVSEWVIGMLLMVMRDLHLSLNTESRTQNELFKTGQSIWNKHITILWKGNIGTHLGNILTAFWAQVQFFTRWDNIRTVAENADIIINCLTANTETENILDTRFFEWLKQGSIFVSVARQSTYDTEALKDALQKWILKVAIDDAASGVVWDIRDPYYQSFKWQENMYTTPHIAWNAESEARKANDIMITNIEVWLRNIPQNLIY